MTPIEEWWLRFFLYFGRITVGAMVVPVFVALWYRKNWNRPLTIAFLYCLATFGVNLIEQVFIWASDNYTELMVPYLQYWEIDNTFFLTILYYVKNFLLLGLFYSLIVQNKFLSQIIRNAGYLLALSATINHFFIEGYKAFGVFNPAIDAIFMFFLPLVYLWESQRSSLRIPLKKNPYLWFSLGIIVPNLVNLFLYLTGDYLYGSDVVLYSQLFSLKNGFEIIGQALISIGFINSYYVRFVSSDDELDTEPANIGS